MRVIAGAAKGRPIRPVRGGAVRPTADRVREALFSILADSVPGCGFLDLYAGTGAVGIEAISRGAAEAVFVESSPAVLEILRENLESTGCSSRARVLAAPVIECLAGGRLPAGRSGIVFADPPYASREGERVLDVLGSPGSPLAPGGVVVLEHAWRTPPVEEAGRLRRVRTARYGDTALSFYRPATPI